MSLTGRMGWENSQWGERITVRRAWVSSRRHLPGLPPWRLRSQWWTSRELRPRRQNQDPRPVASDRSHIESLRKVLKQGSVVKAIRSNEQVVASPGPCSRLRMPTARPNWCNGLASRGARPPDRDCESDSDLRQRGQEFTVRSGWQERPQRTGKIAQGDADW